MKQKLLALGLVFLLLATPMTALASDVTDALYLATVRASENGTAAASNTATTFTANLTTMMNATATDASMQYAGSDVKFMPAPPGSSTWVTYVDDIGKTQNIDYSLYLNGATGGKIRYFPGGAGMTTTSDNVTLPVTDNFTISQTGWIGTDYTQNKYLVRKDEAFITRITDGEEITSAIASGADDYLDYVRANSDWTQVADSADFSFTDGAGNDKPFSISAWVKLDDATSSTIIAKYNSVAPQREWKFHTDASDNLTIVVNNFDASGARKGRQTAAVTAYEGIWTHFAATYDGSETDAGFNIYINGVDSDTTNYSLGAYTGMTNTACDLEIGSSDVGASLFMDGGIAQVKVFARELTPEEVLQDYMDDLTTDYLVGWWLMDEGAGLPADSSGNGNNATANLADWAHGFTGWRTSASVTVTNVSSGEHTVTTGLNSGVYATLVDYGDTLHLTGGANSNVNCGALHNSAPKMWWSFVFKLDTDFTVGAPADFYLLAKWQNGGNYLEILLQNSDGKLYATRANGYSTTFTIRAKNSGGAEITSWTAGQQYHVLLSISDANAVRFRVDNGTVVTHASVLGAPSAGNLVIGDEVAGQGSGPIGVISNVFIGTDDLTPAEEVALLNGSPPSDTVNMYFLDEGSGVIAYDRGTGGNNGAIGAAPTWTSTSRYSDFYLDIDGTSWGENTYGVTVPDNSANWTFIENGSMLYLESQTITVGGVPVQTIAWEYTTGDFIDSTLNGNDATPTFRTASNNLNVTASLIGIAPVTQAKVSTFALGSLTEIFTTVPGAIPQMYSELDFSHIPLAPGINAILDVGEVPQALWWYPFLFGCIGILSLMMYGATTRRIYQGRITDNGDQGSILLMAVVVAVLLSFLGIMNVIPFWPAILIWIPMTAIMLSQKHHSMG